MGNRSIKYQEEVQSSTYRNYLMLRDINISLNQWAERFLSVNPYTNVIGVGRSLIAAGTLFTLLFNNWRLIFPYSQSVVFHPITIFDRYNYFFLLSGQDIRISVLMAIIILCVVIIGVVPPVTGLLHFWITYSFYKYCPIIEGGDQISSIITLSLIPILLFDNRLTHWSKPKADLRPYVNVFANSVLLFIQIQVSIVYFHAFVGKLAVSEWVNGTDTYYWFTHNVFGFPSWLRRTGEILVKKKYIITSITWGTILLEIFLFAAIFMSYKRRLFIFKLAIIFHLGILIIHGLVSFFFAMAGALVIYLIPQKQINFDPKSKKNRYAFTRKSIFAK